MDPKSTKEFEDAVKYDMDGDGDYDADDQAIEEILIKAGWKGNEGSPVKARLDNEAADTPAYPSPAYAGHTIGRVNLWVTILMLAGAVGLLLLLVAILGRI